MMLIPWLTVAAAAGPFAFHVREIDATLKVGYAVITPDLDGDGDADVVVVDAHRVVWYENPSWRRRTITEGRTPADNVCIAAGDISGDGQIDLALGADWNPANTRSGGTVHWLGRGKTLEEPWRLHAIGGEPTVHRMRFIDLDGTSRPQLMVVPLHGRDATRAGNWLDGRPVRMLAFPIPADPVAGPWQPRVFDETLHVVHNFAPVPPQWDAPGDLLAASYEGVTRFRRDGSGWKAERIGEGNQSNPSGNRGASEVKGGWLKTNRPFVAAIEPWHGDQVVVYTPSEAGGWDRQVIDESLKWGHAVWTADLDGDGGDELIIGARDDRDPRQSGQRRGVRIYGSDDGRAWTRQLVDEGGVAVEDLAVADFDGDGRPDLIAVGRQTGNARIYFNRGRTE